MEVRLFIKYTIYFFILLFLQLAVFNNILIGSAGFMPMVLILFLLLLPFELETWQLLLVAFAIGFIYDAFNNSLALYTSAFLTVGLSRNFVLKILSPHDNYVPGSLPSYKKYGISWFLMYSVILTLIFQFFLNLIDILSFAKIGRILLKSFVNTLLSLFFILILHLLFLKNET